MFPALWLCQSHTWAADTTARATMQMVNIAMLNRAHREAVHAQMEAVRGVHEAAGLRVRGPGKPCVVPAPAAPGAVEAAFGTRSAGRRAGAATSQGATVRHQTTPTGAVGQAEAAPAVAPTARADPQATGGAGGTHTYNSSTTRPAARDAGGEDQPAEDNNRQRSTRPAASGAGDAGRPPTARGGQRAGGGDESEQARAVRTGDTGHDRLTTNQVTRKHNSITQKRSRGEGRAAGPARYTKARTALDNASRNT